MNDKKVELVLGSLLHDIGKVLFREDDGRNHSQSGYDFLKDEIRMDNREVLNQVRYHHAGMLKGASLSEDSLAYITYMADNMSAASDRREKEITETGFAKDVPLDSIFNLLNGNNKKGHENPQVLDAEKHIQYPTETPLTFDRDYYHQVKENLVDALKGIEYSDRYLNSLLEVLEANLSFVPSSTSKQEIADVSLYDHMKLTAAIACCLYDFLNEKDRRNYKKELFTDSKGIWEEPVFLLYTMDISGIQDYIYHQYGTEQVLRNLRARSFFLEIMMENIIDELLEETELTRANLIYSGGGHAYMLLPNTEDVKKKIAAFDDRVHAWLLKEFQTDLYLAMGYADCTANMLKNEPEGSYSEVFRRASQAVGVRKLSRYSAGELLELNRAHAQEHERECRICHHSSRLTKEKICERCQDLSDLSEAILSNDRIFYVIRSGRSHEKCIEVFDNCYLTVETEKEVRQSQSDAYQDINAIRRIYSKNRQYTGLNISTKLWIGDYSTARTLGDLVKAGFGIERMGVLRADVDNLGQAFVSGFPAKYQTLSRSASFSRKLSLFFKNYINDVLRNPVYSLDGWKPTRNAAVVYSGGDDLFVVGAWKDVLEFAVDFQNSLEKYTEGALTISAGFGLFNSTYPIAYIADETADLEEASKRLPGKNAITLLDEDKGGSWKWDEFTRLVAGEKLQTLIGFFARFEDKGNSYLYHMVDLLRHRNEKINLARLAYFLARLEPKRDENRNEAQEIQWEEYRKFSKQIYAWMRNEKDTRELLMACYLYVYLNRTRGED